MYTGPHIITDGLVLALDAGNTKSYPGTGTAWNDKSGFGNNATLVNGPTFNSANGGSIVFDGVDDFVDVNNSISNPTSLTAITFIKPSSPINGSGIVWAYRSESVQLIQLTIQSTLAYFQVRGSGGVLLNVTLPITMERTYMIAGIFNKLTGIHTLYVNDTSTTGILDLTGQTLNSTIQNIGKATPGALNYKGNIYQTSVYNRALTAQEIQQNYNSTKTRYGL